jgi:hypothetical protein
MAYNNIKDEHDRALWQHDRAWNDMHEIGLTAGHDSPEYAEARKEVVELMDEVRRVARKPKPPQWKVLRG